MLLSLPIGIEFATVATRCVLFCKFLELGARNKGGWVSWGRRGVNVRVESVWAVRVAESEGLTRRVREVGFSVVR